MDAIRHKYGRDALTTGGLTTPSREDEEDNVPF